MISFRKKRSVPLPEPRPVHAIQNPNFVASHDELRRFRRTVLSWTAGCLLVAAAAGAVYGPWWQVRRVVIKGTVALNPRSIGQVAQAHLDGMAWLIIPRRNMALYRPDHLASYLRKKIEERIAVDGVSVALSDRKTAVITITERRPLFRWDNGQGSVGVIDKEGIIVSLAGPEDTKLPLVANLNGGTVAVKASVIDQRVIQALSAIQQALVAQHFSVDKFIIPVAACPIEPEVIPNPVITNTNAAAVANTNVSNNTNQAGEPTNENINVSRMINVNRPPCDLKKLQFTSQEVHVKLANGPEVYFDRHQNIQTAVQTLNRVLRESGENMRATYIDVRFQDRVYIK